MRFREVLVTAATGLVVLAVATGAQAQSMARRMELLRLQDQASSITVRTFQDPERACPAELPGMLALLGDPRFDRMEVDVQRQFLFALLLCAEVKEPAIALDAANRLEALASEPSDLAAVYSMRISEALQRDDKAEAARRFLQLADRAPSVAATWEPEMLSSFSDGVRGDPELSLKILKTMVELPWTKPASQSAARNNWALSYARLLADRGRTAEAVQAVEKADELYVLLMIAGDRRFETLWPVWQASGRFDCTAVGEAQLARARAAAATSSDHLRPVIETLDLLRALGRHQEAALVGEAYQARLDDGERFVDADIQAELLAVSRGAALLALGRQAEAEAVVRGAVEASPARAIDATIALADILIHTGRGREAATVLDGLDRDYLTPYGRQWLNARRACALEDFDRAGAETLVAGLRKTRDDNPAALSMGLLCQNRIEEAGELLAWRLRSTDYRPGALDPFWITLPPPHLAPGQAEFERRRQAMLAAPQAREALAKVGREVKAPLSGGYWGGF